MTPNYAYKSLLEGGYIDDSNRDLMQKALFLGTYPHFSNRTGAGQHPSDSPDSPSFSRFLGHLVLAVEFGLLVASRRTDRKLANFAANFFNVHLWSMRHRADPAQAAARHVRFCSSAYEVLQRFAVLQCHQARPLSGPSAAPMCEQCQVPGQYAAIDVGEALAFDAFQKHAGVVFNITDDRYSMVFRTSGSALEGDDVVTNHPHLYKNEQDSLYMEKALGAMEEIFGYNVREKIFEDGANGRGSADFTAISVEPRPGAVSIDGSSAIFSMRWQNVGSHFANPFLLSTPQSVILRASAVCFF